MSNSLPQAAIVCSRHTDLVDLSRKVLRQIGIPNIITLNDAATCLQKLLANDDAILLLDWGIGEGECLKILESMQSAHPSGVRPIFLFARSEDDELHGLALEFGVMQVHTGPVSRDLIESRINKLISTQVFNKEIRDGLNACISVRKRGDVNGEITILEKLLMKYPADAFLASELADAYLKIDKVAEAKRTLDPFIKDDQKNPRLLNIHGRCLMKLGKFDEATIYLQQADLINPFNVTRLLNLGEAYIQLDNPQRAKQNFKRALDLDPSSTQATKGMGQSLLLLGDINEALVFLRQISDASEMASVFNVAAVIAIRGGRYEDGMKLYRTACKTVGQGERLVLAKLAFNMGLAHYRNHEWPKALYFFQISSQLAPNYEKGTVGYSALLPRVKENERVAVVGDLIQALLREDWDNDLKGADFQFREKAGDYDMDF